MTKLKCGCKPTDACPHALAHVFFITKTVSKPKTHECVVCHGPYPNCRCFEEEK